MISKTATHALKAMTVLAGEPDQYLGAGNIAERIGAPQNYLGKLLQGYIQTGIVHSQKGKGGGFQLARKPEEITLFEIVEPVDNVSRLEGCYLGRKACSSDNPCALHSKWAGVRDAHLAMLKETTLADLVEHGVSSALN